MMIETKKYYTQARLFPAILTAIPAILSFIEYVSPTYSNILKEISLVLPAITNVILSAAIVFLCVLLNRFFSKEIFQKFYFSDETKMPSTNQLLKSNNELEKSIKQTIESKIKERYSIVLLSAKEEKKNEENARKIIITAVSQIRNDLRQNTMLLQHNIEYGFWRNLIGGSVFAVIVSIVILCITLPFKDDVMKIITIAFICIYLIPIFLSKWIITRHGNYYAKVLFEQFLSLQ
jgi:hypothetical protein